MQYLLFTVLKLNHSDLSHIFKRLIAILIKMGVSNDGRDHDHGHGHGHDRGHARGHDRDRGRDRGHDHDGGHVNG